MKKHLYTCFKTKLRLLLIALWFFASGSGYSQGTWTSVSNGAPYGSGGLMLLLSDGSVMAKSNAGGGSGTVWMKLTPNNGSYANGTWSQLASMANDRLYFAAQVLKDGRVYVGGGEYGAGGGLGEVYDPVTNSWTSTPDPHSIMGSGQNFSDALSAILPDGRVMHGFLGTDPKTGGWCTGYVIYDPATNTYSSGPSAFGNQNEAAMVKLPDNSLLMVDLGSRNSERFIPSQNKWVKDATVPVDIFNSGSQGSESGTAFLLPDGRAFFVGGPSNTAYYTPSGNANPGVWSAGPSIPNAQGQTDAPGAMMPNGKILLAVNPVATDADHFIAPTSFYEFDYLSNSFTRVNGPSGGQTEGYAAFVANMLVLPDGNVLFCHQGDNRYYIYKPSGSPVAVGKPTISQVVCNGTSFTLNGTLFNGISEGSSYGDDWQNASNYPIVRLTNGTNVYYARTYNWNSTGVRTGSATSTTQFTLPNGIPQGTYSLQVIANGISSDPVTFTTNVCNSNGVVTVFKDCNFGGYAAGLNVGDYNTSQLSGIGVLDNDVSSLKIPEGYKVILYDGDNFTGASIVLTADNSCLVNAGTNWNDITSSIQVRTNGATNMAGVYYLQNRNSGLYIDVWGAGTNDGANIAQGTYNGGANQQFQLNHLGDGTYQVLATHSMKSMDIDAIKTTDGANVQQWTYYGTPNQQFIVSPTGDGFYKLIPKHSGKLVEVAGCGTANADNIQQWTNNNQTCGHWKFVAPVAVNGNGDGLTGSYFNGMNFETPRLSRKDLTVNFDWGTGTPDALVNVDQFSARWTGQVQPRYSGIYTFYLNSDNGRRLWINNQLIVDKWVDDWGTEYSGTIVLTAGQKYDIKLEYFENVGGANCKLEWSSILQAREVIPQSQLYSNPAPTVSITSPANNSTFNGPATISLASNAADANGVSKVDYYNGTTLIASTTSPFTYSWTNVAGGTYTITAIATDSKGAVTVSSAVTIQVTAPVTVATVYQNCNFDAAGYSVALPLGNYTTAQMTAKGILDNDISSIKVQTGYKVILYDGDNFTGTALTLTADNSCLVANNFNDIVSSMKITAATTNNAPTVSITSPANNASFNAPASITFNTNAADADGSISKVEFFNGSSLIGTVTTSPYNYTWSNVGAGTYTITAKATDNGGASTVSAAVNVNVNAVSSTVIQAEAYSNMSGIQTETTSDTGGGLNVGWVDAGDWMAYFNINFPTSGNYIIQYRVASPSGGTLSSDLNAGSIQLGSVNVPATGGWQNWTTISQTVNVTAGTYNFGIFAQTGGWNINWFSITPQGPSSAKAGEAISSPDYISETNYDFYPNPANTTLNITSALDLSGAQVKVYDSFGVEVISTSLASDVIDITSIKSGIYTLVISKYGNKTSKRFAKQ